MDPYRSEVKRKGSDEHDGGLRGTPTRNPVKKQQVHKTAHAQVLHLPQTITVSAPAYIQKIKNWEQYWDPTWQCCYYVNISTRVTQWEVPEDWPVDGQSCTGQSAATFSVLRCCYYNFLPLRTARCNYLLLLLLLHYCYYCYCYILRYY